MKKKIVPIIFCGILLIAVIVGIIFSLNKSLFGIMGLIIYSMQLVLK